MKERNTSLDAMKGFIILLVMLGHIINLNEFRDPVLYPIIEAIQMPAFIMISGYISGYKAPIDGFLEWKNIIIKRATTYLIPFFMWLLLKQWDDLPRGLINTIYQLDRGLWFLMTLFVLNLLLYTTQLLNIFFYKKSRWIGLIGFCVIFGFLSSFFALQYLAGNTILSPELTIRYIPPFFLGYIVCVYKDTLEGIFTKTVQFVFFILAGVVFFYLTLRYQAISNSLIALVLAIVKGLLGCYIVFYIFLKSKKNLIKEKLAWIGNYTLEIYTIHFHFATSLNPGKLGYGLYSFKGLLFVLVTFFLMSITSAAFIYMAKQTWITNLLLFGRKLDKKGLK